MPALHCYVLIPSRDTSVASHALAETEAETFIFDDRGHCMRSQASVGSGLTEREWQQRHGSLPRKLPHPQHALRPPPLQR